MTLPSWVGQQPGFEAAQAYSGPGVSLGWSVLPFETYTCIRPPGAPAVSEADDRTIRAFDPDIIWCWRKQAHRPPSSTRVVISTHLCVARYNPHPGRFGRRRMFHVEMPANATHPRPNVLDYVFETVNMTDGGPGDVIHPMLAKHYLRGAFRSVFVDAGRAFEQHARHVQEARESTAARAWDEIEYRKEAVWKNVRPLVERLEWSDWMEYRHRLRGRHRQRTYNV